jgi:FkbH-like protein
MTEQIRASIESSLTAGDWYAAGTQMRRLLLASPNGATAHFILRCFEVEALSSTCTDVRVAFLRSFTLEPAMPLLRAAAVLNGLRLSVQLSDFNTYCQEVLDPGSQMYKFDPEVVILAIQAQDLVPDLWYRHAELDPAAVGEKVEAAERSLADLIRSFRQWHRAYLIVHNLEIPSVAASGVLDAQSDAGQAQAIRRINHAMVKIANQTPGVYVLDYDALVSRYGRLHWRDEQKWLSARMPISAGCLGYLAAEYVRFLIPLAGRTCKALVVDLDNTLWGGVIGEDGLSGIQLGPEYPGAAFLNLQRAILDLYHRGIILAICSKNNAGDALEALENHPHMLLRPHHFSAMRINWNDKAQNLREIAAELNLGISALGFLDDSPQERAQVGRQLPQVCVIDLPKDPMEFSTALREHPAFERLNLSAEDLQRSRYYAEERQRKGLAVQTPSLEEFYRSLEICVEIGAVDADSLKRVAQLTQKTNQFNLTTRRYTEQQIAELLDLADWYVYYLRAADKFGDNGIVGVAMTRKVGENMEIDNLLLSCRVVGRSIENAFLAHLAQEALQQGFHLLLAWVPCC